MNVKCPSCSGLAWLQDLKSANGRTRCPLCCGNGFIARALPAGQVVKLTSSDCGLTRQKYWTPQNGTGSFRGIPVAGKAVATDGVLLIIEQSNGQMFIGHRDNFIRDREKSTKAEKKERNDSANAEER